MYEIYYNFKVMYHILFVLNISLVILLLSLNFDLKQPAWEFFFPAPVQGDRLWLTKLKVALFLYKTY